jgi:hypothetical protein
METRNIIAQKEKKLNKKEKKKENTRLHTSPLDDIYKNS